MGVGPEEFCIFLSTGGGGHEDAETIISNVCDVLKDIPRLRLLVVPGPLFKGKAIRSEHVRWFISESSINLMNAADLAISAAGYNTFNELMHLAIPTVFVPLTAKADDQRSRAESAKNKGLADVITIPEIRSRLRELVTARMSSTFGICDAKAVRAPIPAGAERAAKILLDLLAGI